jgi:N-acetylglucosamine-6-phosphate deacetylase
MKCSGLNALTGSPVEVSFESKITTVAPIQAGRSSTYLAPGWIDLQVNGYAGVDYNNPTIKHEEIARSIQVLFSTGTTRFYPTIITGSPEDMRGALWNLAEARERLPEGPAIEGFHVEGPFISPEDGPRGAHPKRWVRPPSLEEFQRMQGAARGLIRLLTVSPEWPEAPKFIESVAREGVVVSVGHTNATAQQIQDAVAAGATMSTHLGNGAHQVLARHPNYIWEQLAEDRLTAGFIVDGIHLGGSFLKVALRAKGTDRSVLVTDAAMPAGCKPGRYKLGEQEVELTADDRVVLAGQTRLAGSSLRMNHGVGNLVRLGGLSLAHAVQLATLNPARAGRVKDRANGLAAGERGDLVEFRYGAERGQVEVLRTWMAGKLVYST